MMLGVWFMNLRQPASRASEEVNVLNIHSSLTLHYYVHNDFIHEGFLAGDSPPCHA